MTIPMTSSESLPPFEIDKIEIFKKSEYKLPTPEELEGIRQHIEWVLQWNDFAYKNIKVIPGPRISLYEVEMDYKTMKKVKKNESELLVSLASKGARIINPLPEKLAIGIEIPNPNSNNNIRMTDLINSLSFIQSDYHLPICLGITAEGEVIVRDLTKLGNVLIGGDMQQGKTSLLRQFFTSIILKKSFESIRFVIIDASSLDLSHLKDLNSKLGAKSKESSSFVVHREQEAIDTLRCISAEINYRIDKLEKAYVSNIEDYNRRIKKSQLPEDEGHCYMPYLIVFCDELHPMNPENHKEFASELETILKPIAWKVGVHCIFTTRYMMKNTITSEYSSYLPNRICFSVDEKSESKLMLGNEDGKNLLAEGDIIFYEHGNLIRCQTARCEDYDMAPLVDNIIRHYPGKHTYILQDVYSEGMEDVEKSSLSRYQRDPLFNEVAQDIVMFGRGTVNTSYIQRKYEIGYNRAGGIIDELEALGIVGPAMGGKPRSVIVDKETLETIIKTLK